MKHDFASAAWQTCLALGELFKKAGPYGNEIATLLLAKSGFLKPIQVFVEHNQKQEIIETVRIMMDI